MVNLLARLGGIGVQQATMLVRKITAAALARSCLWLCRNTHGRAAP